MARGEYVRLLLHLRGRSRRNLIGFSVPRALPEGRRIYGRRLANVEPVFGNIRAHKRMDRFTLRGRAKVNVQWMLYCLVHNMEKIGKYGAGWN